MTVHDNHSTQLRDGARDITQGASKLASGAKTYFEHTLAPAAKKAARTAKTDFDAKRHEAGGTLALAKRYAATIVFGSAALMFVSLLLPLGKHHGDTVSYLTMPHSDGAFVVIALLAIAALEAFSLSKKQSIKPLRITTGVLATSLGLLALYSGLANLSVLDFSLALFVLIISSITLAAGGVLTLLTPYRK